MMCWPGTSKDKVKAKKKGFSEESEITDSIIENGISKEDSKVSDD